VLTIKTYVDERIKYDYAFADSVTKKEIVNYIPNPLNIWRTKKGICYDIASLFAAMCRS
jgi:transglutaminase-like putative cysteine protease